MHIISQKLAPGSFPPIETPPLFDITSLSCFDAAVNSPASPVDLQELINPGSPSSDLFDHLHSESKFPPQSHLSSCQCSRNQYSTAKRGSFSNSTFADTFQTHSCGFPAVERASNIELELADFDLDFFKPTSSSPVSKEDQIADYPTYLDLPGVEHFEIVDEVRVSEFLVEDLAIQVLEAWVSQRLVTEHSSSVFQSHGAYKTGERPATGQGARHPKSLTRMVREKQKRANGTGSNDENDPNDQRKKRQRKRLQHRNSKQGSGALLLACPYSKHDPRRYSERNTTEKEYRGCSSCFNTNIPRLKQHLYRVHQKPAHYCSSCYLEFHLREDLDVHIRQRPPCIVTMPRFTERMTDDQLNEIKQRDPGKSDEEKWYFIYAVLFPFAIPPRSPYIDDSLDYEVREFMGYFRREALPVIEAGLVSEGLVNTTTEMLHATARVLERSVVQLMTQYNETRVLMSSTVAETTKVDNVRNGSMWPEEDATHVQYNLNDVVESLTDQQHLTAPTAGNEQRTSSVTTDQLVAYSEPVMQITEQVIQNSTYPAFRSSSIDSHGPFPTTQLSTSTTTIAMLQPSTLSFDPDGLSDSTKKIQLTVQSQIQSQYQHQSPSLESAISPSLFPYEYSHFDYSNQSSFFKSNASTKASLSLSSAPYGHHQGPEISLIPDIPSFDLPSLSPEQLTPTSSSYFSMAAKPVPVEPQWTTKHEFWVDGLLEKRNVKPQAQNRNARPLCVRTCTT